MGQVLRVGTGCGATRESLSAGIVGRCAGIASALICGSKSKSTRAAYSRVWDDWEEFLGQVGDGWSPGDLEALLLLFMSFAFEDRVSYSGISKKVAAMCFWARWMV